MMQMTPIYEILSCHNEYLKDGKMTDEWIKDKESFYNNDKLQHKSQLVRILNFYFKNPSQIFKILHSKLKANTEHTSIIKIFTIIVLVFLTLTSSESKLKKQNKIFTIIILFLSILLSIFVKATASYIFIPLSLLTLILPKLKTLNLLPFILLTLNGVIFTILAYSFQIYLIYYVFILYFLTAFFLIEIFNILKSKKILTSYYKNKNKKIE